MDTYLKSALRSARVTALSPDGPDGLELDADLMDAVKLSPHERVTLAFSGSGRRFETAVRPAPRGSGAVGLGGAAAAGAAIGERLDVSAWRLAPPDDAPGQPLVLALDGRNRLEGGFIE